MSVKTERKEVYDLRRHEFVDEVLPTLTVKRSAMVRGDPAATGTIASDSGLIWQKMGSYTIGAGSTLLLHKLRIFVGSRDIYWMLRATGSPILPQENRGTIDCGYFESKGQETNIYDPNAPLSVQPGTFEVWVGSPGSPTWHGYSFEGVCLGGRPS